MQKKGDTIRFAQPPGILSYAAIGGKKEAEGPLAGAFDLLVTDSRCGEKTWEKAESDFARYGLETALKKGRLQPDMLDAVFAGDLQCQCTASAYTMRGFDVPYLGLYGACSTMAEGLALASCMAAGGMMRHAAAMSSSHFCAAERQFRTPLDYGGKRTPTAQWTVTGAGCAIVAPDGGPPYVRGVTFGRVRDYAITDINNMGAAMAPAACETIVRYFQDTGEDPDAFDAIYTGDLGLVGSDLLLQLLERAGLPLQNHKDCGLIVYDRKTQNVQAGGSGAGCSATVLCCHILPALRAGQLKRVLFLSTGALMSQTTFLQGESIPGIAHLVELSAGLPEQEERPAGTAGQQHSAAEQAARPERRPEQNDAAAEQISALLKRQEKAAGQADDGKGQAAGSPERQEGAGQTDDGKEQAAGSPERQEGAGQAGDAADSAAEPAARQGKGGAAQ